MQKIVLQKYVKTSFPVEGISLVNLEDFIEYKTTSEGVYATGKIEINGEYYKGSKTSKFKDEINVDIFSPSDDIMSRADLKVKISDFEYKIQDDSILFDIVLNVDGLNEITKSFQDTEDVQEKEEIINDIIDVEEINEEKIVINEAINEIIRNGNDNQELIENDEETFQEIKNDTILSTLFKNSKRNNYVAFKYHVVLKDETYESIAEDLNINVDDLKNLNKEKTLLEGTFILLP